MDPKEWQTLKGLATNPQLPASDSFLSWLWDGNDRWEGLRRQVEFFAFNGWHHLFRDPNMSRHQARDRARKAANMFLAPSMRASLVRDLQKEFREEILAIEGVADEEEKRRRIAELDTLTYIICDRARKAALAAYERILAQVRREKGGMSPTPLQHSL